jgi:hypothetical protein
MRAHPKTQIQVVTSVRGGTGCQYYAENNRIKDYVLRFNPDLVIIAGVSHGYDVEAMRRVVRQIKRSASCEIMVLSGALAPEEVCRQRYLAAAKLPAAPVPENVAQFLPRLRRMTDEENVEFLDMRSAWDQYLHGSPRPIEWFHRDAIHGNTRGKQVVGRILARYLDPAQE